MIRVYTLTPLIGTELWEAAEGRREQDVQTYSGDNLILNGMKRRDFERWLLKLLVRANITMFKQNKSSLFRNIGYNFFLNPNLIKNKRLILPYLRAWVDEIFS